MGGSGLWFPVLAVCAWPRVPAACLGFLPCLVSLCPPLPLPPGKAAARDWAVAFGGTLLPGRDCFPRPGHLGTGYGSQVR